MRNTYLYYGGGVQSTSLLVLAGLGEVPIDAALFDHVGEDSEAPETLEFVREIAIPWAREHDVPLHVLHKTTREGEQETVLGRITKPGSRSHVIPVKLSGGMIGGRSCTKNFKIDVAGKWLKAQGHNDKDPAIVYMGISLDEIERANNKKAEPYEQIRYPLLDRLMRRSDCAALIRRQPLSPAHTARLREILPGLDFYIRRQLEATDCTMMPEPPPSACWFCPSRRIDAWPRLRAERPERFDRVAELEQWYIDREAEQGKPPVYFSNAGVPITALADPGVQLLPLVDRGDESCDSGWCMS